MPTNNKTSKRSKGSKATKSKQPRHHQDMRHNSFGDILGEVGLLSSKSKSRRKKKQAFKTDPAVESSLMQLHGSYAVYKKHMEQMRSTKLRFQALEAEAKHCHELAVEARKELRILSKKSSQSRKKAKKQLEQHRLLQGAITRNAANQLNNVF